jgi:hypothetical protein
VHAEATTDLVVPEHRGAPEVTCDLPASVVASSTVAEREWSYAHCQRYGLGGHGAQSDRPER